MKKVVEEGKAVRVAVVAAALLTTASVRDVPWVGGLFSLLTLIIVVYVLIRQIDETNKQKETDSREALQPPEEGSPDGSL
jgi:hypothetical protein